MTFTIVNNRAIRFFRNGVAMFSPSEFDTTLLVPVTKIAAIYKVNRLIQFELVNATTIYEQFDSKAEAEAQFLVLEKILTGTQGSASVQTVDRSLLGGPAPDAWALEQLK